MYEPEGRFRLIRVSGWRLGGFALLGQLRQKLNRGLQLCAVYEKLPELFQDRIVIEYYKPEPFGHLAFELVFIWVLRSL